MSARSFIVTVNAGGSSRSQLWNSATPLPLGKPFRWVIENTSGGVRVRHLGGSDQRVETASVSDLSAAMIEQGALVDLPTENRAKEGPATIQVRQVRELDPVFQKPRGHSGDLRIYSCVSNWVVGSDPINDKFIGYFHGEPVFTLYRKSEEYRLDFHVENVQVIRPQSGSDILTEGTILGKVGQALRLSREQLAHTTLDYVSLTWRFDAIESPAFEDQTNPTAAKDPEAVWFKRAVRGSLVGLAAFIVTSIFWPKHKEEELIPPQFARIVMTAPTVQPKSEPSTPSGATSTQSIVDNAPKNVQKAAVVQAFRAKALQSAVSGLLRGGMTSLLAQSDFVAGNKATESARRIFDSKSEALRATGQETGDMNAKNVKVTALGGASGVGANGEKGVGYGKGEHAAVKGQGKSKVSMDIAGSSVEEGLTKDEVGEVIHRHLSEVRYCYESAMLRAPDLEGKLMVNFTIGSLGQVKTSAVKSSTLPDPRLDDCILRRLMTWKFPNTKGGIDVAVTYPFIFKTLGR